MTASLLRHVGVSIEFAHADRIRAAEGRAVGGRMSVEEQSVFLGTTRPFGNIMVCPLLLDHVRTEVEREAKLSKAKIIHMISRDILSQHASDLIQNDVSSGKIPGVGRT